MKFPPFPGWDGFHPLVVHFPVALLLVAPLFLLLGLGIKRWRTPFYVSSLILMLLGTVGAFVAVATGEAGGQLADRTIEGVAGVLEEHEEMAELARNIFAVMTVLLLVILLIRRFWKKAFVEKASMVGIVLFLLAYAGGAVQLANTAHLGGRLVHEFGVQAVMKSSPVPGTSPDASHDEQKLNDKKEKADR